MQMKSGSNLFRFNYPYSDPGVLPFTTFREELFPTPWLISRTTIQLLLYRRKCLLMPSN